MELVEGATLGEHIAPGPVPLDEALPIAIQLADALEYAHERGVVHRDLKPANIKLTPDGEVKLLQARFDSTDVYGLTDQYKRTQSRRTNQRWRRTSKKLGNSSPWRSAT